MFTCFHRDKQRNVFSPQRVNQRHIVDSLPCWTHLLAVKAILSARCDTCAIMAKFLIKRVQATPGMIPGIWFHVFAWNRLVKDVCVFTSTLSCNQSPKPVGTPEHTPQHNSSCGPSPHRRSISDRISDRAARASGQIGCPVRLLTFSGGKQIWAVKKKVRRMPRDAASAHYVNVCAPKQKQWKH